MDRGRPRRGDASRRIRGRLGSFGSAILLVGQFRHTLDEYSWEIPEGGVPEGEDQLEGAKRELAEETGYTAEHWRLLVPRLSLSNSIGDQRGLYLSRLGPRTRNRVPGPTEDIALRWITLEEGSAMIDAGEINDSVTQIGLLRYALEQRS